MEFRIEKDTMGEVKVPATAYYGAQTQRSVENFKIARDINKMPIEIIRAFAYLKKAAAITNFEAGVLPKNKSTLIGKVCDEILQIKGCRLSYVLYLPATMNCRNWFVKKRTRAVERS